MLYLIKFYQDNKLMKELQMENDRMETAVQEAIESQKGYIYWNRIKVETV